MLLTDKWTIIFAVAVIGAIVTIVGIACERDKEHAIFLREHGCHVIFDGETGRTIRHGGAFGPEYVTVYDCADGNRTEVH